jgi:hypothetical protein
VLEVAMVLRPNEVLEVSESVSSDVHEVTDHEVAVLDEGGLE